MESLGKPKCEALTDEQVVQQVLAGETALYEIIMRRYNQRLYRIVRAILRDDNETEDVIQDAYVRAYEHLNQFESRAAFSTWLTRIAIHEALARLRRRSRYQPLEGAEGKGELLVKEKTAFLNPEETSLKSELGRMLEEAILELPEQYRVVLMLRDVEEMSTAETAASLSLSEENVKVRLHRGRALVRKLLYARVGTTAKETFPFMGPRCDRLVQAVFERLGAAKTPGPKAS